MHLGNVQAMIMADCNYLKQTNDTKGHEFGDMLLHTLQKQMELRIVYLTVLYLQK